jgi:asparagine synthase (glutamine-hydrolysing)
MRYWRTHGQLPAIGLRTVIRNALGKNRRNHTPVYPPWLNRGFERRLGLQQQWKTFYSREKPAETVRSAAVRGLRHPLWHNMFESFDPGMSGIPVELRYPFLDLRMISFCLQLPPIPWCVDKLLLRRTFGDILPDIVSKRPKTPLAGFPDFEYLVRSADAENTISCIPEALEAYIDIKTYRKIARHPQKLRPGEQTLITYPLRLARWLKHLDNGTSKAKGRSSWQITGKGRSKKRPITHRNCANMEISTA